MSQRPKLRSSGKLQLLHDDTQLNNEENQIQNFQPQNQIPSKHKSKKKRHKHDKKQKHKEESQVKQQEQSPQELKPKQKRNKLKSTRKKKNQSSQQIKQQPKVHEQQQKKVKTPSKRHKRHSKKKKIHKNRKQSDQNSNQQQDKIEAIDVQAIKIQQERKNFIHKRSNMVRKKELVSFEDSERIIYLFSLDAGDYKGLKEQLPHIGQKNIRNHLRIIFQYCLDRIAERVATSGRKIKEWQPYQKRQIVRQLHRIRSSNRLLSEINVELRQTFHKLMQTYNHPQILMTDHQITFLYRKIESFVRGFTQNNNFRKNTYVPPDEQDERRKPIIEGGYIMQHKNSRECKLTTQKYQPKMVKFDPEKLILEWNEQQQKQICILYLKNVNIQFMIENLRAKFGDNDKWKDFQILGKKIDHIIKLGLNRLQQLTMKPYNREEMIKEEQKRARLKEQARKRKAERIKKQGPSKLQDFNAQLKQIKQGGIIKNPSLLLRQVFAHEGESFRVKHALVRLLVQKYPEQEYIDKILQIIKDFTEWADREEQTNHVTLVRARLPVIDDGTKSRTYSLADEDSDRENELRRQRDEAEIAQGLTLIQDQQEQQLLKRQAQGQVKQYSSSQMTDPYAEDENLKAYSDTKRETKQEESMKNFYYTRIQPIMMNKKAVIQVFESQESEYEGFISNQTAKIKNK